MNEDAINAYAAVTRAQVEALNKDLADYKARNNVALEKIERRLQNIEDKLDGRPTWAVSIIITLLTSTVVGMLVSSYRG